jgi:uncharacterized LabA/DUF88 family protein
MDDNKIVYAFVDASNLFYGGKDLNWQIDYSKLLKYLQTKYNCSKIIYYGGVETHKFKYSIVDYYKPIDLKELTKYLIQKMHNSKTEEKDIILIDKHLKQIKFYQKLESFGYELRLKPVKSYEDADGNPIKKANCDVDMTFDLMRLIGQYDNVVVISGDGDFIPVLSYLRHKERKVRVLAYSKHASVELKQMLVNDFASFTTLANILKFDK